MKRKVAKIKHKVLYDRLDRKEGEKDLHRLARQRDQAGKDAQQVRLIRISIDSFGTSRLNQCKSLLSVWLNYVINNLQLIQNAAARVQTRISKRDHFSPVLASLHWLPVKSRTLRSKSAGLLVVSRIYKSRLRGRAFSFQAALLWNQLPTWV